MSTITCAISKLPILPGEEIVCLPLEFANTYKVGRGKGAIETKGLSTYAYDSFSPLGLIIKGVAGTEKPFLTIYKDGNTESLESYYGFSIEYIIDVLTQSEDKDMIVTTRNSRELDMGIAIFIKRSIFDYIVKADVEDGWQGSIIPILEKQYDELQEAIEEWEKVKDTIDKLEQSYSDKNPFGMMGEHHYRIFSDYRLDYGMRRIYKTALMKNSIREQYIETYTFITRCNNVMGYEFFPTLKGTAKDAIHENIAKVSIAVLSEIKKRNEEDYEEWD